MTQIRDSRTDLLQRAGEAATDRSRGDEQVLALIKEVQKDRTRASELLRVEVKSLDLGTQQALAQLVGQQLKGQIPAEMAKALAAGNVAPELLAELTQRLANSSGANLQDRLAKAPSPESARDMASDRSVPQQALRWTQFVQKVTHVPGGKVQERAGSAAPRGEGTHLTELLSARARGNEAGAGLRSPKLVERAVTDLSPGQRATLMRATFGEKLADELQRLGIGDPLAFVSAGSLPEAREQLAGALNMPRARLLGLLMRAELLKIGPGRSGELGIRPELLGPLRQAGIAMLGSLMMLRTLPREELSLVYQELRKAAGGFARALKGGRPVVKRDMMHWARAAGRRPSDILLADAEERGGRFSRTDAQELIQAWYMENLLWDALASARRRQEELDALRKQREKGEEREEQEPRDGQRRKEQGEEEGEESAWVDEAEPELEFDEERSDNLMCFWITDFNTDPLRPGGMRRMYVCVDPQSGAIIPQAIDTEHPHAM